MGKINQNQHLWLHHKKEQHFILKLSNKQDTWMLNNVNIGWNNILASYDTESMEWTLAVFSDFSKIFKFKFVHLGGDEVNTGTYYEVCPFAEISTLSGNLCMLESTHALLWFQIAGLPLHALNHGMFLSYPGKRTGKCANFIWHLITFLFVVIDTNCHGPVI